MASMKENFATFYNIFTNFQNYYFFRSMDTRFLNELEILVNLFCDRSSREEDVDAALDQLFADFPDGQQKTKIKTSIKLFWNLRRFAER